MQGIGQQTEQIQRISVIVPAYNAQDTLETCLAALQAQSLGPGQYEVIVVDDGSTDRTAEVARRWPVRLIRQPHAGPAAARNRGAAAARGDLLLFTDADCAPAPDWVRELSRPFDRPEVAGAKGVYRTRQKELVARFVQQEYQERYVREARQERLDFVDTYSAAYRRDVFLANGGFDPVFSTASVEDQEFSFRLARKGYRLVFVPTAVVYHRHDTTVGQYWRRKFGIGTWKALLLRWHPERAARDSHTPQTVKAQMGLVALLLPLLPLALFFPWAFWAALGLVGLFILSALPFLWRVARNDPPVAAIVLPMLAVRALALGVGLAVGFLRFARQPAPHRPPISGLNRILKRGLDILLSLVGLVLSAPLMAALALAVRLDSPGPAFFIQERMGENGRPFRMVKLRTMVDGAERMMEHLAGLEPHSVPGLKLRDDPRVTRVGRFLRRTSLDELPQLWNVLKGEMSLVGPRPEQVAVARLYSDWHRQRLAVKPGLTGPMQVNGRADLSLDERVQLELDYIQHYSLWKDLCILARTVVAVISGRGAY